MRTTECACRIGRFTAAALPSAGVHTQRARTDHLGGGLVTEQHPCLRQGSRDRVLKLWPFDPANPALPAAACVVLAARRAAVTALAFLPCAADAPDCTAAEALAVGYEDGRLELLSVACHADGATVEQVCVLRSSLAVIVETRTPESRMCVCETFCGDVPPPNTNVLHLRNTTLSTRAWSAGRCNLEACLLGAGLGIRCARVSCGSNTLYQGTAFCGRHGQAGDGWR